MKAMKVHGRTHPTPEAPLLQSLPCPSTPLSRATFLKSVGLVALGTSLAGMGGTGVARAKTPPPSVGVTVNPDMNINSPYPGSIQEAVDTHDVVYFEPGVYSTNNGALTTDPPLGIYVTERGAKLIGIIGPNGEKPLVRNLQVDLRPENPNCRDATLQNFSVVRIIVVAACHDLVIDNCDFPVLFENFFVIWIGSGRSADREDYDGLGDIPGTTLSIDGKVTITNCTYNGLAGCGVYCTDLDIYSGYVEPTAVTAEFLIQNNTFTGNWYGVLFYKQAESSTFTPKANIRNNIMKDNDIGVGVFCDVVSAGDYVVEQNVIRGNVGLVVYGLSGTMGFCKNDVTVADLSRDSRFMTTLGVLGMTSPNLLVCDNSFHITATTYNPAGVDLEWLSGTILRNNKFDGKCVVGVYLGWPDWSSVTDCVCIGNNVSHLVCDVATFYVAQGSVNNVVKGNTGTVINDSLPGANFLTGTASMKGAPHIGPSISQSMQALVHAAKSYGQP
jgi:hypothetical protein